jgi:hypothetical protein
MESSPELRQWTVRAVIQKSDRAGETTIEHTERTPGIEIALLRWVYGFPWSQFIRVEGTQEEVYAYFANHNVIVRGTGLRQLISDFTAQCIVSIAEPARTEKFGRTGACIEEILVSQVEDEPLAEEQ